MAAAHQSAAMWSDTYSRRRGVKSRMCDSKWSAWGVACGPQPSLNGGPLVALPVGGGDGVHHQGEQDRAEQLLGKRRAVACRPPLASRLLLLLLLLLLALLLLAFPLLALALLALAPALL